MRFFRLVLISCALFGRGAAADEGDAFHIQAHRGGGIALPENTLETFRWSWKRQVTPEADLRTTKDGVIVCFHDADFKRVVRNPEDLKNVGGIEDLNAEEIRHLDVGFFRGRKFASQRVPALASVFLEMQGHPDRLLYIDVKAVDLDALAQLVMKYGVERQVIFTTSDHELIRDWRKLIPDSKTLLWNGDSENELVTKIDSRRAANFDGITHLQIHVRVGDLAGDDPFTPQSEFIKSLGTELEGRGIVFQVLPWECSDERAYERLLALGVDSFATDYPEQTLRAVRRFREKTAAGGKQ
jgi:glycerophosphoryl diester phosphodiesterase